jgi:hypothetical protein
MKSCMFRNIVLITSAVVAVAVVGGCGSKVEGTYSNGGMVTLDLKSGGKAMFTMMGETMPCTYTVKDKKVQLDCTPKGEKADFLIHDDGSLTGPGFIGHMTKPT